MKALQNLKAYVIHASLACLSLIPSASLGQLLTSKQIKRVDSLFTNWDKTNSPGCVLGIIKDGSFIYNRGFGMANLELGVAITPYTVFDIGSTSKQFTATAIILLQQQGKLLLDDNVKKYIPQLPDYGKPITIRELLNHTSGLRDYNGLLSLAGFQEEQVTTTQNALDIINRQKALNFPTAEDWDYTNTGFFLASVIVERVSGKTMKAFSEEYIFKPLGMKNTFFLDNHTTIVPYRATAYAPNESGGFQINMANWEQTGDGAVQTNANDLLLWDRNFYNPTVGGKELIDLLTTPGSLSNGEKINYGLGLFKDDFEGLSMIHHGGAWAGYRAELIRIPSEHFSVICLSNLASFNPSGLARDIARICLADKLKVTTEATKIKEATVSKPITSEMRKAYTGHFKSEANDLIRQVQIENDKLFYVRSTSNKTELMYKGDDDFEMAGSGVSVKFLRSTDNQVVGIAIQSGNAKPQRLNRYAPATYNKASISGATGDYYSAELHATYTLEATDDGLTIILATIPEPFTLSQLAVDSFYGGFGISLNFTRNKNKKIDGFVLSASRTKNILFTRK